MKILVIRASAIGDVFLAGQFAQYIKTALPDAQVEWIAEKRCASVLKHNPYIDRLIIWERNKKDSLFRMIKSAKETSLAEKYDLVIDLQCLLKLFFINARIKTDKRAGISEYEFPMNLFYDRIVRTQRFEPLKEKYLRIAQQVLGYSGEALDPICAYTQEDRKTAEKLFEEIGSNAIACVFATSKAHKYWDMDRWAELSLTVREKYGAKCVLFGAPSDREYADSLMQKSDNFISLAGKTTITESMACLTLCRACVSVDTAMMHFASVLNIPTVSLYGTNFFYAHHFGRKNVEIVFKGDMNNKDRKIPDAQCHENMNRIYPEDIIKALDRHLLS